MQRLETSIHLHLITSRRLFPTPLHKTNNGKARRKGGVQRVQQLALKSCSFAKFHSVPKLLAMIAELQRGVLHHKGIPTVPAHQSRPQKACIKSKHPA